MERNLRRKRERMCLKMGRRGAPKGKAREAVGVRNLIDYGLFGLRKWGK